MLRNPDISREKLNVFLVAEIMITFVQKMKEKIIVICYGQKEVWTSRKKALQFYLEAIQNSEGSERERYTNIYCDLMSHKQICKDEKD